MLRFAGFMAVVLVVSLGVVTVGQPQQPAAPPAQDGQRGARGAGQQSLPPPPAAVAPNAGVGGGGGRGNRGGGGGPAAPAAPTPRWPDGKPRLSAVPGQKGLWRNGGSTAAAGGNTPYQPWARAISEMRRAENLEPHTRCKPSGGPRQFATPYGVEIVDIPDLKRIFIFDVGGPHTFRTIFMDKTEHPKDLVPSYYGHSIGKWEGDTLVVDTIGFNDKMWIDRGQAPHTEKLHLIEKFTRTDMNSMSYELTIDDPGAYTEVFSTAVQTMRFSPTDELFEYVCQDNNLGADLMIGTAQGFAGADRSKDIIP